MEAQLHIINVYLFLKQFNKFASPSLFCPSLSPTYFPSFLSWVFHGSNMLPAKHKTSSWVPEGKHACHSGTLSKWASSSYLKIRSDILHKFVLWVNEIIWMHLVIHKHQSEWWVFQNQKTLHLVFYQSNVFEVPAAVNWRGSLPQLLVSTGPVPHSDSEHRGNYILGILNKGTKYSGNFQGLGSWCPVHGKPVLLPWGRTDGEHTQPTFPLLQVPQQKSPGGEK